LTTRITDLAVQVARLKACNSRRRIVVHDSKRGSEPFHGSWPFNVRWLDIKPDLAVLNPKRHIGIYFSQMPRKLTQRPAIGVWTEIILIERQRAHKRDRAFRLVLPAP
jgi:hypothetical protein